MADLAGYVFNQIWLNLQSFPRDISLPFSLQFSPVRVFAFTV